MQLKLRRRVRRDLVGGLDLFAYAAFDVAMHNQIPRGSQTCRGIVL